MALHSLADIQRIIRDRDDLFAIGTTHCWNEIRKLGFTTADVKSMILALTTDHFRAEFGTCGTDYGDIECDDYTFDYDDDNKCMCPEGQGIVYYIKLGIFEDSAGDWCVVARFHLNMRP